MSKTVKIVIAAAVAVVLVAGAGIWYFALRDTADKTASLSTIGGGTTPPNAPAKATPDGSWKVQQDTGVFGGYRMLELFGGQTIKKTATGRSSAVDGTMTIAGNQITAAEVNVDTTKLKSDEDRRDAQLVNKGLQTQKFPKATFKLTSPIVLTAPPAKDQEITVTAKGDLTLHGVTKSVEIPLKATWNGSTVKVATVGEGLPIALKDYGMDPIEIPGFVKTDDNGTLELQLLFVPA